MPVENVRCIYLEGSGCYGRNGHEDAAADAALLARAVGRPVRVQWTRADEHGWDPKGPPTLIDMRGGARRQRQSGRLGDPSSSSPKAPPATCRSSLRNWPDCRTRPRSRPATSSRTRPCPTALPNIRTTCHRLANTPFRPSWIRTPGRMQNTYANEAFLDELAAAAGIDPLDFRLQVPRRIRAASRCCSVWPRSTKWEKRPSPQKDDQAATSCSGRGLSYVKYELIRTYVGAVAEVEVNRATGEIRVPRFYVVHDCGQIINPDGLRNQIEGNIVQTVSRTLKEELTFDRAHGDEPRLGELPDPDLSGGPRRGHRPDRPADKRSPGARASPRPPWCRRPSPTPSSMPPGSACARCLSRRRR